MSDTPKTDAAANAIGASGTDWHHSATLMRRHAEKLELELRDLRAELSEAKDLIAEIQGKCDHNFVTEDHSFSHEYGTEKIFVCRCEICGKTRDADDGPFPEADDEPPIDQRELRDFPP